VIDDGRTVDVMEWSDVVRHLTGTAHIATVDATGRPHVAKVLPAVDDDAVWIATRASSKKARNAGATGRAAVMWEPGAEAYVQARVEVVTDAATKRRMWESGSFPVPLEGFFGAPDHPDFVLLRLEPTAAVVMSQGPDGIRRDSWHA
jgi:general stress protein 26